MVAQSVIPATLKTTTSATAAEIWQVLENVPDPEIPVVSLRELGILRDVNLDANGSWQIIITPTYSGCPAMAQIAEDITQAMQQAGVECFKIQTVLAPAWTTDWITEEAKEKLRAYGIAPPGKCQANPVVGEKIVQFHSWRAVNEDSPCCPQCGSPNTQLIAQHGSTACKALYKCLSCQEPFDYFKPY